MQTTQFPPASAGVLIRRGHSLNALEEARETYGGAWNRLTHQEQANIIEKILREKKSQEVQP